jgi:hypothetical protein
VSDNSIFIGAESGGGNPQKLELGWANRHGLIAGATGTGTGTTVTLQGIVEGLSAAGVPTFVADVKGDLAGLGMAGSPTAKTHDIFEAGPTISAMPAGSIATARRCGSARATSPAARAGKARSPTASASRRRLMRARRAKRRGRL